MVKYWFGIAALSKKEYLHLVERATQAEVERSNLQDENSKLVSSLESLESKASSLENQKEVAVRDMQEYEKVVNEYHSDKIKFEEENSKLRLELENMSKDNFVVPKLERTVLKLFIPPVSRVPNLEKIKVSIANHHRPNGYEKFLKHLADCPYVKEVRDLGGIRPNVRKTKISASPRKTEDEEFNLTIIYANDRATKLEARTTAETEMQLAYVQEYLVRCLRLKE